MKPVTSLVSFSIVVAVLSLVLTTPSGASTGIDQLGKCNAAHRAATLDDERLLVLGTTGDDCSGQMSQEGERLTVTRLEAGGSLDVSYGEGGISVPPLGQEFNTTDPLEFAADDTGGALVWQRSGTLVRLTPAGRLDEGFGDGGVASSVDVLQTPEELKEVAFDHQGRAMLIVAKHPGMFLVARLGSDGRLDPGFGVGGTATVTPDGLLPDESVNTWDPKIAVDPAGNILVVGKTEERVFVLRLDPEGDVDSSFAGGQGTLWMQAESHGVPAQVYGIGVDAAGFSIAFGYYSNPYWYQLQFQAIFSMNGVPAQGPTEGAWNPHGVVQFPTGLIAAIVGRPPTRDVNGQPFRFGLQGTWEMVTEIGAAESRTNGVASEPDGPPFAVGVASSNPCRYVRSGRVRETVRATGCPSSMVVYKAGDAAFGDGGFVTIPELRCDHGYLESGYRRCGLPTGKITPRVSSSLRIRRAGPRGPLLRGAIAVDPSLDRLRIRIPEKLVPPKGSGTFWKRISASQGKRKLDLRRIGTNVVSMYPDPSSGLPIRFRIGSGGLAKLPPGQKRFRFGLTMRGYDYEFKWQSRPLWVRVAGR